MPEPLLSHPDQIEVNFELIAMRCERCHVGDVTRTDAAAEAFAAQHAGHRYDVAYLVKATGPRPFMGGVWWVRLTGLH